MKWFIIIAMLLLPCWVGAATYYVIDLPATGCADNNPASATVDGTDYNEVDEDCDGGGTSSYYTTVADINAAAATLTPGDTISFNKGGIWRETLEIPESGTSGAGVYTYTSHGTGDAPIISGADDISTAGWADQGGNVWRHEIGATEPFIVIFDGVVGVEDATPAAQYEWTYTNPNLDIYSTSDPDSQSYYTLIEAGQRDEVISDNSKTYITIDGLKITGSNYATGTGGAIDIRGNAAGVWTIQNCTVTLNRWSGIIFVNDNTVVTGNTITYNYQGGIYNHPNSDGSTVTENVVTYNYWAAGIAIQGTNTTVTYNSIHHNGFNAILGADGTTGHVVSYNDMYTNGTAIGDESDLTQLHEVYWMANSSTISYNLIHDGSGKANGIDLDQGASTNYFVHNTFYNLPGTGGSFGHGFVFQDGNGECINNVLKNNIFSNNRIQVAFADDIGADNLQGNVLDKNIYHVGTGTEVGYANGNKTLAQWKAMTGSPDPNSIDSDPLLTNPGSADFTLQYGSPAYDFGENLGATYDDCLHPSSSWPSSVVTVDQDLYPRWEIGAYCILKQKGPGVGLTQ
jgi:hypothetical protein